jgi:transglutaminase-like putative cysteine protease
MVKKIALSLSILICSIWSLNAQVLQKKSPTWIEKSSYEENPAINLDENSQGTSLLLADNQINNATKEFYYRYVTKIVENVGIQPASTIEVEYDPSYQKLTFHEINVIRDGEVLSKLNANDFQLIRKERNSESYIYDGTMSALNNLSDIRNGDIIDYSYTITGTNPIHGNKFSTIVVLNDFIPYGKLNTIILSKNPLQFHFKNTDATFETSRKNGYYKYHYSNTNIPAIEFEENIPSWYLMNSLAFVSDYKSWSEVVNWGVKTFRVNESPSKEFGDKIQDIKKNYKTNGERLTAVLNFVQDDIRYLGLESGIGAYKPFSPNKVFEQRFGDCKDKSLLMVHMLRRMDIDAYPVLVNTSLKGEVEDFLPSPKYFDHCIVKVELNSGASYFYDPTIANQGGDYRNTSLPDYAMGLVLKRYNKNLEEIEANAINLVDVTDEFVLEEVGKGASLKCITQYYDLQADVMRNYFMNNGIKSIRRDYEQYLSEFYGNIQATENPTYTDDLDDNIFTVTEHYTIDSIWTENSFEKKKKIASFHPYALISSLAMPSKRERTYPYALPYPLTKNHTISLKLPTEFTIEPEYISDAHENLYYSLATSYDQNEQEAIIRYSIKTTADHVAPETFNDFYTTMTKIDNTISYSLLAPKSGSAFSLPDLNMTGIVGQLILALLIVLVLIFIIGKFLNKSQNDYKRP